MSVYGLTATGFLAKPMSQIVSDIETALQATFGANIDVSDKSNFGQLVGVIGEQVADVWAQAQAVWDAFTEDGATGASLDFIEGLRGVLRLTPLPSTVAITCCGTPGTVLAVSPGQVVQVTTTGFLFTSAITNAAGTPVGTNSTIAALAAWTATTPYATVGQRVTNFGNAYQLVTAGVSAGSGGPSGTTSSITDGSCVWKYIGQGTGTVDVPFQSEIRNAIFAAAGSLVTINTPVAGWNTAVNLADAVLGRGPESDSAYRSRSEVTIREGGSAYLEAIRSAILALTLSTPPVTACTVFENVTDFTDADGRPPHSIEALVSGGAPLDVATAIFDSVAAGIATYGTGAGAEAVTVTDSQGVTHVINYSVPALVNIYVSITVYYDPLDPLWAQGTAPGIAAVQEAIVFYGNNFKVAADIAAAALGAQAFQVSGVMDTPVVNIGLAPSPGSGATIDLGPRQQPVFQTTNVVVTATPSPN
ncbi:MAG TPA: hypothetical protein VKT80_17220 [Chloroflexota bacterium]|nr:hypothetical protein [Chloroflexota bacterium]